MSSGRMRFRSAWVETGKGQAKSPWMAATGLYLLGYYGIARSEVYSIGQDRKTANVLFKDAVAMCRAAVPAAEGEEIDDDDTLENRGEVVIRGEGDNAWKIEHLETGSKFQALANGESISGPRPTAILADEIHEFKANDSIETWKRAIGKMPGDSIMILGTNTPAATQIVGNDYSEHYQRVVKGEVNDDEAFAFIARVCQQRGSATDLGWRLGLPVRQQHQDRDLRHQLLIVAFLPKQPGTHEHATSSQRLGSPPRARGRIARKSDVASKACFA
ncbi:terminase large subunit domain-containing protein [Mesorhizobium sp. AR07]|uniref:terminase large subunit domain-containing protein n=1 Tax=Mesorhizobium sp. AR07 TaxID=2865838 RepID=UPI0029E815FC|nr:terminase large subunit [Mesorhizobium sp. AR07]